MRREVERQLGQTLPGHNIRLIPRERSLVTSWGSFGIVRAHMEQFEELCRYVTAAIAFSFNMNSEGWACGTL